MTPPGWLDDAGVAERVERSRRVRAWWSGSGRWTAGGDQPVGLALSGGGIRSATFSLGLIQGLAKAPRDALGKIDVLSTVSGGGYIGCFLRSLFVPTALRGIAPPTRTADLAAKAGQYRLARATLASAPCSREISTPDDGTTIRNPLWWLREHSRYLAPTGATDYGYALAYLSRNWIAMIFLVLLASVALATAIVGGEVWSLDTAQSRGIGNFDVRPIGRLFVLLATPPARAFGVEPEIRTLLQPADGSSAIDVPISPLFVLAALPALFSATLMLAYWTTQGMSVNEASAARQKRSLLRATGLLVFAAAAVAIIVTLPLLRSTLPAERIGELGKGFLAVIGSGSALTVVGLVVALATALIVMLLRGFIARWKDQATTSAPELFTAELRRILTGALATSNGALLVIVLVALVDSIGAALSTALRSVEVSVLGPALLPAAAMALKKLSDLLGRDSGGGEGKIAAFLRQHATLVALVVGALLYAMVVIGAFVLVHAAVWTGTPWISEPRWQRLTVIAGIAGVLCVVLGGSTGFINLSSLHAFYASRLTRAFLGASNVERLEQVVAHRSAAPITENHRRDYIQPEIYGSADLPAPIHIVNVTLNETIDPRSQIVSRDRKGDILSLEPDGIRVGDRLTPWAELIDPALPRGRRAENISLGQWIAISGAAASSGMGRLSSLGFALAFTFANIRLGYWWWAPRLCADAPVSTGVSGFLGRHLGTFAYLFNEMTCRYSRGYHRKYLTDGGHYEDSGAFVLIRRGVPLILVTDNGADPGYDFGDLEALVRQVRLDLGGETTILGGAALAAVLARLGTTDASIFVDPEAHPDWRKRMTKATAPAYVLVLGVEVGRETLTVIWVKPRMLPGTPTDVVGYHAAMPSFPQQSTDDQFFDEAQWESYRRLGELSMTRLLETCPKLLA